MGKDFEVTKKKEAVPSKALNGYNRCSLRRERDIHVKEEKGIENVYEKAVPIKDLIRTALFHVATDEEIEATLELSFQEIDYPTKETAKLHVADAYRQIMRYVSCEKRTPEIMGAKVVRPFDLMDVKVKPEIQKGRFYRLLNPQTGNEGAWNFVSEDEKTVIYCHYQILSEAVQVNMPVKLKGLRENKNYRLLQNDTCYGGDELMYAGITVPPVKKRFCEQCIYF